MTSTQSTTDDAEEYCASCDEPTPHQVHIALVTENTGSDNASFSREPYRVTTCLHCGEETRTRMNNA